MTNHECMAMAFTLILILVVIVDVVSKLFWYSVTNLCQRRLFIENCDNIKHTSLMFMSADSFYCGSRRGLVSSVLAY